MEFAGNPLLETVSIVPNVRKIMKPKQLPLVASANTKVAYFRSLIWRSPCGDFSLQSAWNFPGELSSTKEIWVIASFLNFGKISKYSYCSVNYTLFFWIVEWSYLLRFLIKEFLWFMQHRNRYVCPISLYIHRNNMFFKEWNRAKQGYIRNINHGRGHFHWI